MSNRVATSVLLAAQSPGGGVGAYDLTDMATVVDELQLSSSDALAKAAFLQRAITQTSAAIANYCNRVFQVETVRDTITPDRDPYPYQVPGAFRTLQLARFPLVNSDTVAATASAAVSTGASIPLSVSAGISAGMPAHVPSLPQALAYDAYVVSVSAGTVTLSAPLSAPIPAGTQFSFGLRVSVQTSVDSWLDLLQEVDFRIDAATGQLIRLNSFTGMVSDWESLRTNVRYQAGYATIPPDVVQCALQLIAARNTDRTRDPFLKAIETPVAGRKEFWVGQAPVSSGPFPATISAMLDAYRAVVVG